MQAVLQGTVFYVMSNDLDSHLTGNLSACRRRQLFGQRWHGWKYTMIDIRTQLGADGPIVTCLPSQVVQPGNVSHDLD